MVKWYYMVLFICYLKKRMMGGVKYNIDGYKYLNNIIELWPEDW